MASPGGTVRGCGVLEPHPASTQLSSAACPPPCSSGPGCPHPLPPLLVGVTPPPAPPSWWCPGDCIRPLASSRADIQPVQSPRRDPVFTGSIWNPSRTTSCFCLWPGAQCILCFESLGLGFPQKTHFLLTGHSGPGPAVRPRFQQDRERAGATAKSVAALWTLGFYACTGQSRSRAPGEEASSPRPDGLRLAA